jgi:hypothetical protein
LLIKLKIYTEKRFDLLDHKTQHLFSQPRIHTDPQSVVHDVVGVGQFVADAIGATFEIRLARKIAREQQARTYLVLI